MSRPKNPHLGPVEPDKPRDPLAEATCRDPHYIRAFIDHGEIIPWESRCGSEDLDYAQRRHLKAAMLCKACPVREACIERAERMFADCKPIDGVIAGVTPGVRRETLGKCKKCKRIIVPIEGMRVVDSPWPDEMPGSLCPDCFDIDRLPRVRKRSKSRKSARSRGRAGPDPP